MAINSILRKNAVRKKTQGMVKNYYFPPPGLNLLLSKLLTKTTSINTFSLTSLSLLSYTKAGLNT
jgi:hypothetical protein